MNSSNTPINDALKYMEQQESQLRSHIIIDYITIILGAGFIAMFFYLLPSEPSNFESIKELTAYFDSKLDSQFLVILGGFILGSGIANLATHRQVRVKNRLIKNVLIQLNDS